MQEKLALQRKLIFKIEKHEQNVNGFFNSIKVRFENTLNSKINSIEQTNSQVGDISRALSEFNEKMEVDCVELIDEGIDSDW